EGAVLGLSGSVGDMSRYGINVLWERMPTFFPLIQRVRDAPFFPYTSLFRSGRATGPVPRARGYAPAPARFPGTRAGAGAYPRALVRKSTRLNSRQMATSYVVFCLKKTRNLRVIPSGSCVEITLCLSRLRVYP